MAGSIVLLDFLYYVLADCGRLNWLADHDKRSRYDLQTVARYSNDRMSDFLFFFREIHLFMRPRMWYEAGLRSGVRFCEVLFLTGACTKDSHILYIRFAILLGGKNAVELKVIEKSKFISRRCFSAVDVYEYCIIDFSKLCNRSFEIFETYFEEPDLKSHGFKNTCLCVYDFMCVHNRA